MSLRGDLLPRWRDAFPQAASTAAGEKVSRGDTPSLLWLRLQAGLPVAKQIEAARRQYPEAPIVVLSDQSSDDEALDCFAVGARGYCNTHAVPELLRRVADVVLQGGLWIGEALMQRLLQGTARIPVSAPAGASSDWSALLTERERQVALAVAEGASNKEIARQLGITERTVKAHTGAIFEKLGVRDRMQLSLVVHGRRSC
ncbi:MAG: response regulator transcription factor [Gammaproteobacteria bacterium]|nr:response regulator transcription factor [Gammaproteobacteria bacterium]MBU1416772.1 response regulator transcription factor [Gammaproteobacteria bacterium]